MDKRGHYRGIFYSSVSFGLIFTVLVDSDPFITSSETSLHWSYGLLAGYLQCEVRLMHCKMLLYRIYCFEAVVMFRSYSDSLVSLFISFQPKMNQSEIGRLPTSKNQLLCKLKDLKQTFSVEIAHF